MEIKIDTIKKTMYVPQEVARELKEEVKRKKVSIFQALERTQYLEDIKIVTVANRRKELGEEEHKINKMTLVEIEEDMKSKSEAEQKEYADFIKSEKEKIKGQLTKAGTQKKVNSMRIKTWYKNKYMKPTKKSSK